MSGGQKQRLAIARSVVSNPCVLLLDEATSALDPSAERIVQKALNNVAVGRTMLVIAHRLSTIRDADNIVVLSAGNVVEQGNHNDLIAQGGVYSRLVGAQDLGQENEETESADQSAEHEKLAFSKTLSSRESRGRVAETPEAPADSTNYGLLKCLAIILGEQRSLWGVSAVLVFVCVVAGKSTTRPYKPICASQTNCGNLRSYVSGPGHPLLEDHGCVYSPGRRDDQRRRLLFSDVLRCRPRKSCGLWSPGLAL